MLMHCNLSIVRPCLVHVHNNIRVMVVHTEIMGYRSETVEQRI